MVDLSTPNTHGEDTLVEWYSVGKHRLGVVNSPVEGVVGSVGILGGRVTTDEVARALHIFLILHHDDEAARDEDELRLALCMC